MNLSAKTIEILKNFQTINQSIVIKEGNVLSTISTGKTIIARAKVPDTFQKKFALYQLNKLINTVTNFDEPEKAVLTFNDKLVRIEDGNNKEEFSELFYGDEQSIKVPPEKTIVLPSIEASCKINSHSLKTVQRQLGILGVPDIGIFGDGKNVYLQAFDSKNIGGDKFSIKIGETDKNFRSVFKSENLKIMPGDYDVDICAKGLSHFKGADVEYWIAVEANSSYN